MAGILIGTSGYDYLEWKGVFYPEKVKRADFLTYYSTIFNALELNNTFYSMPTKERMLSFYERSQGRLSFSVKGPGLLTHQVGPAWQLAAREFQTAVSPLLEKDSLYSVLFQFPQSFHYAKDNRIYLAKLIDLFRDFPLVIEFRHKEWIRQSVFQGLEERGASVAFCDMPRLSALPGETPFLGSLAYIRLHGRNAQAWYAKDSGSNGSERYRYDYSDQELQDFLPVIQSAVSAGKKTAVFFNNHPKGNGANNARRLGELVKDKLGI